MSVYPLFAPISLVAEGTANYGVELAFPQPSSESPSRRSTLFPLAGLDPAEADRAIPFSSWTLKRKLSHAGNEAARRYLDGRDRRRARGRTEADPLLAAVARAGAERRLRFHRDPYRAYVINYNLGQDLVKAYVEALAGAPDPARRWAAFTGLLSSPRLPSGLVGGR